MANFFTIPGTHEVIDLDLLGYNPELDILGFEDNDSSVLDRTIADCERLALEDSYD